MSHRRNIIEDEQRVKSISELPFSPLPHGVPGPWTDQVVREIQLLPDLPEIPAATTHRPAWHLRRGMAIYSQDYTDVSPPLARQKERPEEPFGIIFSFVPRRLLPDKHRSRRFSGPTIPICRRP